MSAFHAGYTTYVPGSHLISPALEAQEPVDQRTGFRLDALRYGQQPMVTLPNWQGYEKRYPVRAYVAHGVDRWPGPPANLPRQFKPNLGALAGTKQRGWMQSGITTWLRPVFPYPQLRQYRSIRTTTQRPRTANVAIPGVFVPTSPMSFYGSRGSA